LKLLFLSRLFTIVLATPSRGGGEVATSCGAHALRSAITTTNSQLKTTYVHIILKVRC
jgi:hypothetical protein